MNPLSDSPSMQPVADARRELLAGASTLGEQARRLLRWRAVVRWLTITFVAAALLVFMDALLQREEIGLRVLWLVTLLVCTGYAGYRTLVPAWRFSPTLLQVAQWVERSQPEAGEQLSTVVQLAEIPIDESKFGSAQFRDSAIKDWVRAGFHPVWESYLDTGRWWKSVTWFALLLATLIACIIAWPQESWIGLSRLAAPWVARPWPRADRLQLQNPPLAVAAGSQNQVEIIDTKPPLPQDVSLQFRRASGESHPITVIPATAIGEIAVANLPPAESTFEIRAVGGEDESMKWHRVDVVQPPLVDSFHFLVELPQYAGGESSEIVGKRIPALAGSRIQFVGHLNAPASGLGLKLFASAAVKDTESSESSANNWKIKLQDNRQDFAIEDAAGGPWLAMQSVSWQINVRTVDNLEITLPDLWSIDVVQDARPVVLLREPMMREVSASAVIPLMGQATDDLGLVKVVARAEFGQAIRTEQLGVEPNSAISENQAGSIAESIELNIWEAVTVNTDPRQLSKTVPKEKAIDTNWESLIGLQAAAESSSTSFQGSEFSVWIEATDTLGQIGRSQPQVFSIRTREQLLTSLEEKQRQLLEQIRELSESQRKNTQLAARSTRIIAQSGKADQEAVDTLASISQIQSTISRQLSRDSSSLRSAIEDIADLYEMNQLMDAEGLLELSQWKQKISDISDSSMPAAVQTAYEAYQTINSALVESSPSTLPDINVEQQAKLDASATAQALVAEQLQSLLDRASRSETIQQAQRELRSIFRDQRQHKLDTEAFQLQSIASENSDRRAAERAGLSVDQQSMARRLDGLVARVRALASSADQDDNSQLAGANEAADILVERQASDLMRRSADRIQEQQLADGVKLQSDVLEVLEDALARTSDSVSSPGGTLAQQASELRQLGEAVAALAEQQAALAEEMATGDSAQIEALAEEQSQLRAATEGKARELSQRTGDTSTAQKMASAVQQQDAALTELAQEHLSAANQNAAQAAQQLAQAVEELDRQSQQLDSAAKQQKIFELAQAIDGLVEQQQSVVEELDELARLQTIGPSADLEERMRMVAAAEEEIRRTVGKLRGGTTKLPAFDWALEQIGADMARCVAASQRFLISPDATSAAQAALRKLIIVQEAIQSTAADTQSPGPNGSAGNSPDSDDAGNDRLVPPLASLKLLRGLQADVNQQTQALDSEPTPGPRRRQMAENLSAQQKTLGERLEQLMLEFEQAAMEAEQQPVNQ